MLMMATNDNATPPIENFLSTHFNNPDRLQELACVVASTSILFREMEVYGRINVIPYYQVTYADPYIRGIVNLPSVFWRMIRDCKKKVADSFDRWCSYLYVYIFPHRDLTDTGFVSKLIDFICWRTDGTIDDKRTALNVIELDVLNKEEKYRIACLYCLIDDVRKLWPITTNLQDHPMIRYWNSQMSGEQFAMPVNRESSCVEAFLLRYNHADTISAFDYLWVFLTDDEQVQKVINLASYRARPNYLEHALCILSETQLLRVMMSNAEEIFCHLYIYKAMDLIMRLWNWVKNVITNDMFYRVFHMFLTRFSTVGHGLAYDIWISAPRTLKNHVLNDHFEEVLEILYAPDEDTLEGLSKDVRLLIELLKTRDAEMRERIWRENWSDIIVGVSREYLQQIIELCLESNEVISFKNTHLCNYPEIEKYSMTLVDGIYFDELSEFLRFCSDDPYDIFNLRVAVLKSRIMFEIYTSFWYRSEIITSFETFFNETFSDTDQLNTYKRNLIMGEQMMEYFKHSLRSWDVRDIIHIVDFFISLESDLVVVKSKLFELSSDIVISGEWRWMDADTFDEFFKWCLHNDTEAVENFKLILPVDRICKKMLERCAWEAERLQELEIFQTDWVIQFKIFGMCFHKLEGFLDWIFPSKKAAQNFKLGKINAHKRVEPIRLLLESNQNAIIDASLEWFFNNDESLMEQFKSSLIRNLNDERCAERSSDFSSRCKMPFLN